VAGPRSTTTGGHLEYYKAHGIAPVLYQTQDLGAHLERRDSLYRSLGLPPVAFRGARVLEVASGTGQNSLYVAHCRPQSLDLVEPNPAGLAAIARAYEAFPLRHTAPVVHATRLEEFAPETTFDIVLCENWLGADPHEIDLLRKIAGLVAPGGILVLTIVPLSGFFPNIMRKLLALRVLPPGLDFETQTEFLVEAFGPHLSTMADMTRSHRDWVQDCLINPHYLNVALPLDTVLDALDREMEALATFPRFVNDWRWFKTLAGKNRRFNQNLSEAYRRNVHNFVDYRRLWAERDSAANADLERAFHAVHQAALAWQAAFLTDNAAAMAARTAEIGGLLQTIGKGLGDIDRELGTSIAELLAVWAAPSVTAPMVRNMSNFGALFGRETIYLSLTRPVAPDPR
jgi:SAM-dependent methyltransferase